jgi:hypothetical protein
MIANKDMTETKASYTLILLEYPLASRKPFVHYEL